MKIAHIICPVKVNPNSDLYYAQPITFKAMENAKNYSSGCDFEVEQYYTCFEEDIDIAPSHLGFAGFLTRSVLDFSTFTERRKLPLLGDILEKLNAVSDADIFVYSNVDIAVMPYFYNSIQRILMTGVDAFVVNRRTIDGGFTNVEELPVMYSMIGDPHPGYDCFIFNRSHYLRYDLKNVCIGINWVGVALLWNLQAFSSRFEEYSDLHLTFHVGNDKIWKNEIFSDYVSYNKMNAKEVYLYLQDNNRTFEDRKMWDLLNK